MTNGLPHEGQSDTQKRAAERLARLSRVTRFVLVIEHLLPASLLIASLWIGLLGLVWLGLFQSLPASFAQCVLVGGCAVSALLAWLWIRFELPTHNDARARLDEDNNKKYRAARSFADPLALNADDPLSQKLWQTHQRRLAQIILSFAWPRPILHFSQKDPVALRYLAILLLVCGYFAAGTERTARLRAALSFPSEDAASLALREDGWIDPPAYTQIPPIMLALHHYQHGERPVFTIPVGSHIVLRRSGGPTLNPEPHGTLLHVPADHASPSPEQDLRYKINGDSRLSVDLMGDRHIEFEFHVLPDTPPTIRVVKPPVLDPQDSLALTYAWQDDYGVTTGQLEILGLVEDEVRLQHPPLLDPPTLALGFYPDPRQGESKQSLRFDHPLWSGLSVEARLSVQDEAQQTGISETFRFQIPQRPFTHPLARALDEQRKNLIRSPQHQRAIFMALDALMVAPDYFTPQYGLYLSLHRVRRWLALPYEKARLTEAAQWLWDMAQMLEADQLGDAERALQAAQNALKDALDRGASLGELKQLSDAVRDALKNLMQALAERMQKDTNPSNEMADQNQGQTITPQDLKALMDQLDQALKRGDTDQAMRLLEQLKNITRNLQAARPNQGSRSQNQKNLDELERMARDQQNLRDKTYREGLDRQQERRQPKSDQRKDPHGPLSDLQNNQQALRERLDQFRKKLQQNNKGQQDFADADQAMREAERALEQGQEAEALDAQNRALQNLRKGAEELAQSMRQRGGPGEGDGEGEIGANPDGADPLNPQNQGERDPLGRLMPSQTHDDRSRLYEDGKRSSSEERARALLDEVRRRLGEVDRNPAEIDYLKRLLQSESVGNKP